MADIAFRLEAGAEIGSGHLSRCAALASAMRQRGWTTHLYGSAETLRMAERAEGFSTCTAVGPSEALPERHDVLVVDHYGLGADYEDNARRAAGAVLVISDGPGRPHASDILVDQNIGRAPRDYDGLVPDGCVVLTGADYVMLGGTYRATGRPEGPALRAPARNLLVTFGGSDPQDATGKVLTMLKAIAPPRWHIRVVLGPSYRHAAAIMEMTRTWPALEVERAPKDLLASIRWADAAISAAGGTLWELCFLGVPFAALNIGSVPNTNAQRLEDMGAAISLGDLAALKPERLAGAVSMIMEDGDRRTSMATSAFRLIDGRGAERICDAIERHLCRA